MLIDSHCHLHMLDLTAYQNDISVLLQHIHQAGVTTLLTVGVDVASSQTVVKIAEQFEQVFASVGVHPSESLTPIHDWQIISQLATHPKVIAIGETGLDYYYHQTGLEQQRENFRQHIRLAKQVSKPLIIHSRNAPADTIAIMQQEQAQTVAGIMHCFTESWDMAEQALALGFYISFSGIITFKNAQAVAEVATQVPLERLLIETDAPYLAPIPYRGKPNQPQYVRYVAEKIAELKQIPYSQVVEQTAANFRNLFVSVHGTH